MKGSFRQANDAYDDSECLELIAYEAFAQRSAILREIRASIGFDMELRLDLNLSDDLVELHKALLQQTVHCVEIARNLEAARCKLRDMC
jgi:hypothetical protein